MNYFGVDFGTTNTVVAVSDGTTTTTIPLKDEGEHHSIPTVLFFPGDTPVILIGRQATQEYVDDPEGGRYLRSIKSLLSSSTFDSTLIRGKKMDAETLVSTFLAELRDKIRADHGVDVEDVTLGHPVRFCDDPAMHEVAKERLVRAAMQAGFKTVHLCPEPVSALYGYAHQTQITTPIKVLVCDIGGGTSDFTLADVSPSDGVFPHVEVLDVAGARIGGDDFDSEVMWEKLAYSFGRGTTYSGAFGGSPMNIPMSLMTKLKKWHLIPLLRDRKTFETIQRMVRTSSDPQAIERLISLVKHNSGLEVFREIEHLKIVLTKTMSGSINLEDLDLDLEVTLTREEFEAIVAEIIDGIMQAMLGFLHKNNTLPQQVDRVFVVGGTSGIPAFQSKLQEHFTGETLVYGDAFLSIAYGLATYGAVVEK